MLLHLFLVFLIPIALYCLILAGINRRLHPVMVSGLWDCVGLLFAASGFLLVVVPGILSILYVKSLRQLPFEHKANSGPADLLNLWSEWWGIWLFYYAAVVAGAAALLWYRRLKTIVYNVDPDHWERVFSQVLAKLGLEQIRSGKQIVIGAAPPQEEETLVMATAVAPEPLHLAERPRPAPMITGRTAVLHVERFPAMCNITLHWEGPLPAWRDEIESELAKGLQQLETMDNPAAAWFLGIGGSLVGLILLMVLVLVLVTFFPLRP